MFDEPVSIIPLNIFDEGSYTIIVADLAGNISEPKSFIFDFTKPTLEVPEFINTSYYQFSFSELILGYSIDDGNAWISLEEPSNTIDLVDLPEGAINIQVVDLAKNYSINYSINIDYTDPTVTLTKMFNDRFYSLSIADNNDYEIVSILKDATPLEIPKVLVFEVSGQYEITVRDSFQNETIFNFEIPNIPTISLVQSQPLILEVNSPIPDLTSYFIANDMKDGEIAITSDMIFTDLTLETIGDYLVTCKVEDSDGNVSSASILISVISQSPVIKISKEADSFLHPNFEAPDFTTYFEAYDAIDGFIDITSDMITTDFISNTPGEYSIECNVTDSDGNMSTASINVIVIDYIFIESITDLDNIRNNPYSAYILANDIEFNDSIWIPFEFFGVFDGNGYTISGINVNITSTDTYAGLFSINHGTVRNVNITNTNINIENWITVYAGVIAGINSGNIYNVNVSGNVTASINSYLHNGNETAVGGIVGKNTGLITNTSFSGSTTAYIPNNMEAYVGGISGQNEYGTLINVSANVNAITRSYFLSHSYVYNPRYIYIGGISGTNKQGTITNASSSGKLDSELFFENKYIGGITGSNGGTINCSESSVTIYSNSYDDTDEYYGGITGYNGGEIRNVLSKVYIRPSLNGLDSGMSYIYVGGIAGRNNGSIDYAISVATLEAKAIFTNYDVDGVHDTRYVGLLVGGNFGFITNSLAEGSIDLVNIYQVFGVNPNVHAGSIYGYKGSTSVIENTYVSEASTFEAYNIYRSNIISSVYFQKLSFYEYLDLDFSIWDISNISLDGIHGLLLN
jgi:hypothetical protein